MQTKQKEAVNQPESKQFSIMTAQVGKQIANYLVPNYNEGQTLAIVDEEVLKYLTELLPTATTYHITSTLIDKLKDARNNSDNILEDIVGICKNFVAFHETVNLLRKYFDPNVKVEREQPFNVTPDAMSLDDLLQYRNVTIDELKDIDNRIFSHKDYKAPEPVQPTLHDLYTLRNDLENEMKELQKQIEAHPERREEVQVVAVERKPNPNI